MWMISERKWKTQKIWREKKAEKKGKFHKFELVFVTEKDERELFHIFCLKWAFELQTPRSWNFFSLTKTNMRKGNNYNSSVLRITAAFCEREVAELRLSLISLSPSSCNDFLARDFLAITGKEFLRPTLFFVERLLLLWFMWPFTCSSFMLLPNFGMVIASNICCVAATDEAFVRFIAGDVRIDMRTLPRLLFVLEFEAEIVVVLMLLLLLFEVAMSCIKTVLTPLFGSYENNKIFC